MGEAVILEPEDPFDAALIPIVLTNRRKRRDYAIDGDPFSNFRATSELIGVSGFAPIDSALFNVLQKIARLQSLRMNGRLNNPANESVLDTYLDLAVYAIITYALALENYGRLQNTINTPSSTKNVGANSGKTWTSS